MRTLWIAGLCILVISTGWAQDKCTDNTDCPEGWYCAKIDGGCDGPGMCEKRPDACLAVWDPVCGCDGQTYSNACYAAEAGVNVAHPGPCVKTACKDNDGCEEGWYCHKAEGDCQGEGECLRRPGVCPDVWDPVCGCDGQTYGNPCEAAMSGMNIAYRGPCLPEACDDNADCPDGWYCARAEGNCDGKGECRERPVACPEVWDPVCGCDNQTYGNACFAAMAGVNVAYRGPCIPPGPTTVMMEPRVMPDDVHTGPSGVPRLRILWSEPVRFASEDVNVVDESGAPVEYVAEGTDTAIMTLRFTAALSRNRYVITIADTVTGLDSELPIDGDDDGRAGGNAVIVLEHRRRADFTGDNRIDLEDLARFAEAWLRIE